MDSMERELLMDGKNLYMTIALKLVTIYILRCPSITTKNSLDSGGFLAEVYPNPGKLR
jgi:hypothetical protein